MAKRALASLFYDAQTCFTRCSCWFCPLAPSRLIIFSRVPPDVCSRAHWTQHSVRSLAFA